MRIVHYFVFAVIVIGIGIARCQAVEVPADDSVVSLMPANSQITQLKARAPESDQFTYQIREVGGQIFFESTIANAWYPDPLQADTIPDGTGEVYLEFLRTARGQIIASQPAKGHNPQLRLYWTVDWQAHPPRILTGGDFEKAAVWTYETVQVDRKPEVAESRVKPIGTYFITRGSDSRPFYLGISRSSEHRVSKGSGRIHELFAPVLNTDALWGFDLAIAWKTPGEKMPTELAPELALVAPEETDRGRAGNWTRQDPLVVKARGSILLGGDHPPRALSLLEGQLLWREDFHFGRNAKPWREQQKSQDPAIRTAWRMHRENPNVRLYPTLTPNDVRLGWASLTGAGYRFLAVDWTAKPPLVTITRQPDQAAIWTLPGPPLEGMNLSSVQKSGPISTEDDTHRTWYLASQADVISVPFHTGGNERYFLPVLSDHPQPAVMFQAAVPPPPIDGP